MKRPTQKHVKAFRRGAVKLLASHGVTLNQYDEGTLTTPFGPVHVHLHHYWCHFRLNSFDAPYPGSWYGFRHWKYNCHPSDSQHLDGSAVDHLTEHLQTLFRVRDSRFGFPTAAELAKKGERDAQRERLWAEAFASA